MTTVQNLEIAEVRSVLTDLCQYYTAREHHREDIRKLVVHLRDLQRSFEAGQNESAWNIHFNEHGRHAQKDYYRIVAELWSIREKIWKEKFEWVKEAREDHVPHLISLEADYSLQTSTVSRLAILVQSCVKSLHTWRELADLSAIANTIDFAALKGKSRDRQQLENQTATHGLIEEVTFPWTSPKKIRQKRQKQGRETIRPTFPTNRQPLLKTDDTLDHVRQKEAAARHQQYNSDVQPFGEPVEARTLQGTLDFGAERKLERNDADLSLVDAYSDANSFDSRNTYLSRSISGSEGTTKYVKGVVDWQALRRRLSEPGLYNDYLASSNDDYDSSSDSDGGLVMVRRKPAEMDPLHASEKETNDNTTRGDYEQSFLIESSSLDTKSKSTDLFSSHRPTTHITSLTSISQQPDESKDPIADTADRLTIRSQFDRETLNLEEGDESQLIAIFVEELFQAIHGKLGYMPEPEDVKKPVAELLKSYTFLVQLTVASQNPFCKRAVDFVRSRRMKIANKFESFGGANSTISDDAISERNASDVLQYGYKVSSWLQGLGGDSMQEPLQDVIVEQPDSSRVSELTLATAQMRRFLTANEAWNWLVHRLSRTCVDGSQSLSDRILECFEQSGASVRNELIQVHYIVDWQPQRFLADEFPPDRQPALENVITITSVEGGVFATTCGDYVKSAWPTFGSEMLDAIDFVVHNGNERTVALPHHTIATIRLDGTNLAVNATSCTAILADIGEFLGWLGSACRSSPFDNRHCFCTVTCAVSEDEILIQNSGHFICKLDFELSRLDTDTDTGNTCWHHLFRNVSIARGFTVPERQNNEPGLELSAQLMILLGDTPWANVHNGRFMLKGFSSMYIPVEFQDGSIFWHFVRQGKDFIPYSTASSSCVKKTHITTADLAWLFEQRHFVGWTIRAEKHLGTETNDYSAIDDPNTDFMRSGMVLKEATISTGKFLNFELTAARGNHQTPLAATRSDDYLQHLNHIESTNVILYDTGSKKAWLVDGPSALLHITCSQLRSADFVKKHNLLSTNLAQYASNDRSPADVLRDWSTRRLLIRDEGQQDEGTDSAAETVKDPTAIWRFGDLVASNCDYLLKMHEHQVRPPSGLDVRFTDRHRLEGWSFTDVVEHVAFIQPRMVYLRPSGRGWTHYTRTIQAVTLMGEGFGELITPATATCQRWKDVPEGRDYLTTTIDRLVWNSRKHGNRKDFPAFLARGVRWHQAHQLFDGCSCATKRCNPVQVILPQLSFATRQPQIHRERYDHGAIIFGQNERFRFWYPPNPRQEPEVDLDGAKESKDPTTVRESSTSSETEPVDPYQHEELSSLSGSDSADRKLLSPVLSHATNSSTPATSVQSRPDIGILASEHAIDPTTATPSNDALELNTMQLPRGTLTYDTGSSSSKQAKAQNSKVSEPRQAAKAIWRNWKPHFTKWNQEK